MPSEDAHHSFIKCSQQPLLEQTTTDSLLVPLPATGTIANPPIASNQTLIQQQHHQQQPLPPPPPPNNHLHLLHRQQQQQQQRQQSTQSPLPPPTLNSHCYLPKNDPQFHAV